MLHGGRRYLNSLRLTTKLAESESISRKVESKGKGNPDSALDILKSYGFTDSQISNVVTIYPGLLRLDAQKSLAPKLKFLQAKGASSSELTEVISTVPKILGRKGNETFSIYYDFIKEIIAAERGSKVSHSFPQRSKQANMMKNLLKLKDIGVPPKHLFTFLTAHNKIISGKERFEESLKKVVDIGFDPTSPKFVEALNVIYSMSDETIEEKVNVYRRLGFSVQDVRFTFKTFPRILALSEKNILNTLETFIGLGFSRDEFTMMVKRHPPCIAYSTKMVKEKAEFLVKKMNWRLACCPEIFSYSMEKRIVPRCNVVKLSGPKD